MRKLIDRETKLAYVQQIIDGKMTAPAAAKELGVHETTVYDNACAETFFHSFKVEWIFDNAFETRDECLKSVRSYVEVFYNRQRLHSHLGYRTPAQFEKAA